LGVVRRHLMQEAAALTREIRKVEAEIRRLDVSYNRLDEFWWALGEGDRALSRIIVSPFDLAPENMKTVVRAIIEEFMPIMEREAGRAWTCWLSTLIDALRRPTRCEGLLDLIASLHLRIEREMRADVVWKLAAEDRLRDLRPRAAEALRGAGDVVVAIRVVSEAGS